MAVTIRELLGEVRGLLDAMPPGDPAAAVSAAGGLAPIGRALDRLYGFPPEDPLGGASRTPEIEALTRACCDAARCWPDARGRVADMLGATADAIGRNTRSYTHEQRWALAEALAESARRCTDAAQRFEPYASLPQLTAARVAAVACERRAALLPAAAADHTVLDHLIPARHLTADASEIIVDAAAALHIAVARGRYYPRLCVAEMVITLNAAQLAATHAAAALRRHASYEPRWSPDLSIEEPRVQPFGLAAPDAWRAARICCASFDDGTKLRPPDDSRIASAAARLGRAMLDSFGTATAPKRPAEFDEGGTLAVLQTVTDLLPDVATSLTRATRTWIDSRQLWAPERRLLSYEHRNQAATDPTGIGRTAVVEHIDLEPLNASLHTAARLTAALASELARYVPGHVRQPHMIAAHKATVAAISDLSIQAQSAHDAVRRAHAVNAHEWTLPTAPRQTRARQR